MKWLNRLLTNLALRSDRIRGLMERASEAIRETALIARAHMGEESLMSSEVELAKAMMRERMNEIIMIRSANLACVDPKGFLAFAEARGPVTNAAQFKERLWELELALEDRGWVREVTLSNLEFSRLGVQQLIRITRIYAIKNPLIKRGVEIRAIYVFGRGVEIRSEDDTENQVIQQFLEANKAELSHIGLAMKEQSIGTDGALYFALPSKPDGTVTVTMIDPLEVMDVICDPDDVSKPWYFLRNWTREDFNPTDGRTSKQMECWYPSVELHESTDGPAKAAKARKIGNIDVNWDMPIYRVKVGAPQNWRWGIPPAYASIDWARAYKDALEDYATVRRALARFALMVETQGGPAAIAAYSALLNTTFANDSGTQIEKNPPPVTGSAHIGGTGTKITPFKTSGVQSSPEELRRMMLMVAAADGMPETFYGDASTGSLATAQSLDRPTELKFKEIQQRWIQTITDILRYVLNHSQKSAGSAMRDAWKAWEAKAKEAAAKKAIKTTTLADSGSLIVKFPAVLEHDIQQMVQAIAESACLGGRTGIAAGILDRRTIADLFLQELGYEKRTELLDKIFGTNYNPADDVTDQRSQVPPQSLTAPTGKPKTDLSTPPPLPEPPPPPTPVMVHPDALPKPSVPALPSPADKAKTEALILASTNLKEAALALAAHGD